VGSSGRLRLTLDLHEGEFTVKPGESGSDVRVEGEYPPGLFDLTEHHHTDPGTGERRAIVLFGSKAPMWVRIFASIGGGGGSNKPPKLTVTIPRGSPVDLDLNMSMGKSEVDLGGLTLGEVSVRSAMGEHRIDFQEPVVEGLRQLRLDNSMGNVVLENLGNARAKSVTSSGSMGNITVNLGGAWPPGAEADFNFEQSMGELTVRVPSTIRLDSEVRTQDGKTTKSGDTAAPEDPKAPSIRLRVNSSMGNARVVRY
jgi:hypothetical protein